MCNSKKNQFISELDQYLADIDQANPQLSPAQQYERNKYARVNRLRDQAVTEEAKVAGDIWDKF
jgi:hypothetical protein